jgi:hypothetical protein
MPERTIRLYHRIAVDWVADTFGLRGEGAAQGRHDRARDRARTLARRLPGRLHERGTALARSLPDRLHQPREPRVLTSWQVRIGQLGGADRSRS